MSDLIDDILTLLQDDLLSYGSFQYVVNAAPTVENRNVPQALAEVLASGKVEIGNARIARPDYVEFIAWKGAVQERVERGMRSVELADDSDREFAFWLALHENIDAFETE